MFVFVKFFFLFRLKRVENKRANSQPRIQIKEQHHYDQEKKNKKQENRRNDESEAAHILCVALLSFSIYTLVIYIVTRQIPQARRKTNACMVYGATAAGVPHFNQTEQPLSTQLSLNLCLKQTFCLCR